jgi:hypothetical protein
MTEAERLRAQAARCTELANTKTDKAIVDTLLKLAAKSLEQASDLERAAEQRRDRYKTAP